MRPMSDHPPLTRYGFVLTAMLSVISAIGIWFVFQTRKVEEPPANAMQTGAITAQD